MQGLELGTVGRAMGEVTMYRVTLGYLMHLAASLTKQR
jgi:hypothetical protein